MDKVRLTFEEQSRLTEEEELVQFWREHPIEAQKDLIGYNLNWFQRIMLRQFWDHKFNLWVQGRGCSKTFMMAICFSLWGILYPGWNIGVIAPVFRQANFVFDEIDKIWHKSPFFRSSTKGPISRTMERTILRFTNGSFIEALPLGDGTKVRGRRYRLLGIDEYAQTPEHIIKQVVGPFLTIKLGGYENKLLRASSAYFKHNHLWPLYVKHRIDSIEKPNLYTVLEFNYKDILADTVNLDYQVDMDMIQEFMDIMTEDEFAMEMLAKFPSGSMGFFSHQLLDSCIKRQYPFEIELEGEPGCEYVMAVDAARKTDNFAITIVKLKGTKKQIVRVIAHRNISFQEMVHVIRDTYSKFNVVSLIIDEDGGGMAIRDLLREKGKSKDERYAMPLIELDADPSVDGMRIVKLMKFSMPSKSRIYHRAKAEMEQGRVQFPIDVRNHGDKEMDQAAKEIILLKTEMGVVEKEETLYGAKFIVPRKYNDDRVDTFCMAVTEACDYQEFHGTHDDLHNVTGVWV